MDVRKHAVLGFVVLAGCAAELADPGRFESDEVCDFDVHQQLLVPRCALAGCHVPYEPTGDIEYLSADLGRRLLGAPASTCAGELLIDPVDPDASFFLTRLSPDPQCDGMPLEDGQMPQTGPKLDEHELECVRQWVHAIAAGETE
jgi:hypothetical protein